jgi:hypothetical protein
MKNMLYCVQKYNNENHGAVKPTNKQEIDVERY